MGELMKKLAPLPHAVVDYVYAAQMLTAPRLLGFTHDKRATRCSIYSGAAILGLSLFTRYPLGVVKAIPFPVHGVIEALAGVSNIAAPWLYGFANNKRAKWLHILSGVATLGIVAVTDYQASERRAAQPSAELQAAQASVDEAFTSQTYQVSTAAEYDDYTARPPYSHYGDEKEQLPLVPPR